MASFFVCLLSVIQYFNLIVIFRKVVASFNKEVISFKKEGYPLLPEINMRHEKGLWHVGKVGQSIFFVEGWREKKT